MSLEHAILGFLTYRPMSGYDLKKFFDESVRHFWSAPQSQIYRTLGRDEEALAAARRGIERAERRLELNPDDTRALNLALGGLVGLRRRR